MDHMAHEEIAAATAAHRELGAGCDDAVAEGLVERFGGEIDKRVDARLALRSEPAPARPGWVPAVIGTGSMVCGVGATAIVVFARLPISTAHFTTRSAAPRSCLLPSYGRSSPS